MGDYGSTDTEELYCHHNHSCDVVSFHDSKGRVMDMSFMSWSTDKDKWDAMQKLWFPFKDKWGEELLEGVEYYSEFKDES